METQADNFSCGKNGSDKEAPKYYLALFYQDLGVMIIESTSPPKITLGGGKGTLGTRIHALFSPQRKYSTLQAP